MSVKAHTTFLAVLLVNFIVWTVCYVVPGITPAGITRGDALITATISLVGFALLASRVPR